MKRFARLYEKLDRTNKTNAKVDHLKDYFIEAHDRDKLWAISLFSGKRPQRQVRTSLLREWSAELAGIPSWLFDESYHVVGDLAETIALLLPSPVSGQTEGLSDWVRSLNELSRKTDGEKKDMVTGAWMQMDRGERLVFNKLITGGFRIGVSQRLVVRALSAMTGIGTPEITHRLMGKWHPERTSFEDLILKGDHRTDASRPYPFFLAHQIDEEPDLPGSPDEWHAEWKWDGIRAQMIFRGGEQYIWSRGEDLITEKFPELIILRDAIPEGNVLDGEILPYMNGRPMSFGKLQTRIGRKNITRKHLKEAPVVFMAYDLMEWQGKDYRKMPLFERRRKLKYLVQSVDHPGIFLFSNEVEFDSWEELMVKHKKARSNHTEGLMIKHIKSPYEVGRKRGAWWKWKTDPLTVDAVLIYAQPGHGRRAGLYTDYTLAVWDDDELVPFAKAYSGLTNEEISEVDRYIKQNTLQRYGPVRTVRPGLVFELAFEGMQRSGRHKSGIALRFPRIHRWRRDLAIKDADDLAYLYNLLEKFFE